MNEFQGTIKFHRDYVAKANCSRWEFNIEGPDWIVSELCREMREYGLLHLNGPGGKMNSKTLGFMLGTGVGAGKDDGRLMRHPLVRRLQDTQRKQPPGLTRADVLAWPIEKLRERVAVDVMGAEKVYDGYVGGAEYRFPKESRLKRVSVSRFRPDMNPEHNYALVDAMLGKGWQRTISILPSGPGETKIRVTFYPMLCAGVPASMDGDAKDEPILTCQAAVLADLGL